MENGWHISQHLTRIAGSKKSLIEEPAELLLQTTALKKEEKGEILFRILNKIERPPISSVLEVIAADQIQSIALTTRYAKYKILFWDPSSGKITYSFAENHATSSVRTQENSLPNAKGAMNQRVVFDEGTKTLIGAYCGELSTPFHVFEQLLWILNEKEGEARVTDSSQANTLIERKVLFTSLFSWTEFDLITRQRSAIASWDQKAVVAHNCAYQLDLLYFNIPFNRLPIPGESRAVLKDINEEALISLTDAFYLRYNLHSAQLNAIAMQLQSIRRDRESDFIEREEKIRKAIDQFKGMKGELAEAVREVDQGAGLALHALLIDQMPEGKPLKGIDKLIFLNCVTEELGYHHNKNCQNATDRASSADAADKALYAFKTICATPFLPGYATSEELSLFKILYSMYLVWEEPEINQALNNGYISESSAQSNP